MLHAVFKILLKFLLPNQHSVIFLFLFQGENLIRIAVGLSGLETQHSLKTREKKRKQIQFYDTIICFDGE